MNPSVSPVSSSLEPYDALLIVSFGGPEQPADVMAFLENVTRGRDIPRQRLEEVAGHYQAFGGRSPINDQNRALVAALRDELAGADVTLPVYWGNRNWRPYLRDEVARMMADGVQRAAAFVTSAYSSYSGCRQYREDLAGALEAVGPGAPRIDRVRQYFDHPGFIEANANGVVGSLGELSADERDGARLVFVTHSIPVAMAETAGPSGGAYVAQHQATAYAVAAKVAELTGVAREHELVYCSRSGSPHVPWLVPDVNDRLVELAKEGATPSVVLAPIGFVSDHMEVVFDLDTEAMATAREVGLSAVRAASAGVHPAFVSMVHELVAERAAVERGELVRPVSACPGVGPAPDVCPSGCCRNLRRPMPALGDLP